MTSYIVTLTLIILPLAYERQIKDNHVQSKLTFGILVQLTHHSGQVSSVMDQRIVLKPFLLYSGDTER